MIKWLSTQTNYIMNLINPNVRGLSYLGFNFMADDALAPYIARTSAAMTFTM